MRLKRCAIGLNKGGDEKNEKIFKIKWSGKYGFDENAVWYALHYVYGDDGEIVVEEQEGTPEAVIEEIKEAAG